MREPWLARWQDVVCLTVAGAFAATWFMLGDGAHGIVTSPYVAGVVFVVTWLAIDFVVAYLITRRERRAAAEAEAAKAAKNRKRKRTAPPVPPAPQLPRARLPRAIARLRRAR